MREMSTAHRFEEQGIRGIWDPENRIWLLSIVDIMAALEVSSQPRRYWSDLKRSGQVDRETLRSIRRPKPPSADGSLRITDVIAITDLPAILATVHSDRVPRLIRWAGELIPPDDAQTDAGRQERPPIAHAAGGSTLMPLVEATFEPGGSLEAVHAIEDPDSRAIAMAEYHYFRGEAQAASDLSEPYLASPDPLLCLSACWIHGYANLTLGRTDRTQRTLLVARRFLASPSLFAVSPQVTAQGVLAATGAAVLLHLPIPENLPTLESIMPDLPEGLRLLAAYVNAHRMYLEGEWAASVGFAEAALSFSTASHPIPQLYLHLICVMDRMSLRQPQAAYEHLMTAWGVARDDGFIEPFAEHHGLLGGMLERCIKPRWPDEFRRIIDLTYHFSYGWRRVHNATTGNEVADTLSTTQFTCAMLASRGWANKEIAAHLGVSVNTVKACLSEVYAKLGISRREQLGPFMLR